MQTPPPSSPDPEQSPVPNTPLDMALHMAALRRLVVSWRERAAASAEREARVYRQVEADLTSVISAHAETHAVWAAARRDLVRALTEALEERSRRDPGSPG